MSHLSRHEPKPRRLQRAGGPALRSLGEGGFALLVTIVLVAFLVLILVGLASFTRVETQVASNAQQLAAARQNAIMALNLAVGELQKYAGPDQRVTTRADIDPARVQLPNSRWTGVYGSAVAADYGQTPANLTANLTTTALINPVTGSQAVLLNWLVSGNETTPFDPAAHVGVGGRITTSPAAGIAFQPGQTIQNLTASTTADASNLTLGNAPAKLLVGPGSTRTDVDGFNVPVDYVVAPLIPITTSAAHLPGFDPAGSSIEIGRYAWWVGDEGIKARVNLPPAATSSDPVALARPLSSPPRAAVELMTAAGPLAPDLESPPIGATAYDLNRSADLVALSQFPMLGAGGPALPNFAKNRFHDLTTHSFSVLSDTYAGGLRRDLTRLLVDGQTTADTAPDTLLFTPDPATLGAPEDQYVPTWGLLRSHYHGLPLNPDGSLSPRLPTPTQSGIAPVMTYYSLGWRYATVGPATEGADITLNLYPLVVLWNPYDVPIRAPANHYEVGIYPTSDVEIWLEKNEPGYTPPNANLNADWPRVESRHFQRIRNLGVTTGIEYIRFRLNCPEIGPGESRVFALSSSGSAYPATVGDSLPILENVTPNPTHYVTLPTGHTVESTTDAEGAAGPKDYRVFAHPNFGASFGGGTGGVLAYLGEAGANSAIPTPFDTQHDPWLSSQPKRWYSAHQDTGWNSIAVPGSILQGPGPLQSGDGEEPAYAFMIQAVFSGDGSNGINGVLPGHQLYPSRWIAQGNLRAPITGRTRRDGNRNIHYSAIAGVHGGTLDWKNFVSSPSAPDRASSGLGHDVGAGGPADVTLFEVRSPSEEQLFSLGQLQHAPVSTVSAYPSYAIGNSLADLRLPGQSLVMTAAAGSIQRLSNRQKAVYDLSFLINRALWDRYYFSSIPASGSVPENPRLVRLEAPSTTDLLNLDRAAASLLVAGGFNINSTSEQAWRAILGGANRADYGSPPPAWAPSDPSQSPLARFSRPSTSPDHAGWQGYRALTERQIAELARNIVEEVRSRGPFMSLGDFVNRRLADTATNPRGLKGALQAAIDRATIPGGINDTSDAFWTASANANVLGTPYIASNTLGVTGAPPSPEDGISNRSAFAPKYLTQADVLSAIGSVISARSDTFTVRTYGDVLDPVNSTPANPVVLARAWCEAVVQRLPEHAGSSVDPWDQPAAGSAGALFGRKFQIISFRWLSPEDI